MSLEDRALCRDDRLDADRQVLEIEVDDPIDELEILNPHGLLALLALCCDQFVDASAEVLQHEVLLCGGLAVVDFLSPLLERQLNPERLIDGEGNVEKVQAVDAEVVDGVALRRDRVARNVA